MAKQLIVMRHGDKAKASDVQKELGITAEQITPEGFERARDLGLKLIDTYGLTTDLFHSHELRTAQTLLSLMAGGCAGGARLHGVVNGLFNSRMLEKLDMKVFGAAMTKGVTNYEATIAATTPRDLEALCIECGEAIVEMFIKMTGDVGLAVSHDPIITLAGERHGWKNPHSLEPLGYLVFTLKDNGEITVTDEG